MKQDYDKKWREEALELAQGDKINNMKITQMIYKAKAEYEMTHYIRPEQITLSKAHVDELKNELGQIMVFDEKYVGQGSEIYGMKIVVVDEYLPVAGMIK